MNSHNRDSSYVNNSSTDKNLQKKNVGEECLHYSKNLSKPPVPAKPKKNTVLEHKTKVTSHGNILLAHWSFMLWTKTEYSNFCIIKNNDNFLLQKSDRNDQITTTILLTKYLFKDRKVSTLKNLVQDFSLQQYIDKPSDNKNFDKIILFTTGKMKISQHEQLEITEDISLPVEVHQEKIDNALNTNITEGYCYKIKVLSNTDQKYKVFFDKFYLYVDQSKFDIIENNLSTKFCETFGCLFNSFKNYLTFINHCFRIDKELIKNVITFAVLHNCIKPLEYCEVSEKAKIFRRATSHFDVTVCTKNHNYIDKVWGDIVFEDADWTEISILLDMYQLDGAKNKIERITKTKLMWLMGKCPLFIKDNSTTTVKVVKIFKLKNVVIFKENFDEVEDKMCCSTFRHLADLSVDKENILENFWCSLQGKKAISLKMLGRLNPDLDKIVTTDELLQMAGEDTLTVGECQEKKDVYIHRSIDTTINYEDKINLICAESGMGKSTVLKNLRSNLSSDYWLIIIYSSDIVSFFSNNESITAENFMEFIKQQNYEHYSVFEREMVKIFWKNRKTIYAWDGLNELTSQNLEKVLRIINSISEKQFIQIITCRPYLQEKFEKRFKIGAKIIQPFSSEEQKLYLNEAIQDKQILQKVENIIKNLDHGKIFTIPLHLFMLVDLTLSDQKCYEIFEEERTCVVNLFRNFINNRFNIIYINKTNLKTETTDNFLKENYSVHKSFILEKYERTAMKMLFPTIDEFVNYDVYKAKDPLGFLVENIRTTCFAHNSIEEYFAACFLQKNDQYKNKLQDSLDKPEYSYVISFLNLLPSFDNSDNNTVALYKDCLHSKEERAQFLLASGANANAKCNDNKCTPFYISCKKNDWKVANMLIFSGADVNMQYDGGNTLLHEGCLEKNYELCEFLLKSEKIDINKRNDEGSSPLHLACKNEDFQIVQLLLKNSNISVNVVDNKCVTPLHVSCELGCGNIVKLLTTHGADWTIQNIQGLSPQDVAEEKKYIDILDMLRGLENYKNYDEIQSQKPKNISKSFKIRKGTRSEGDFFEDIMTAHCTLNLLKTRIYKNFHISSNNGEFKYFDDIVIELENCDGKYEILAIQLKHAENNRHISRDNLTADNGDFALKKYVGINDVEKMCDQLILFTNRKIDLESNSTLSLNLDLQNKEKFDIEIKVIKCIANYVVNSSISGNCYTFQVTNELPNNEHNKEKISVLQKFKLFFQKFYLYTNQSSAAKVKQIVSNNFYLTFGKSERLFDDFVNFIGKWNGLSGKKYKLTKEVIGRVLVLLMSNICTITSGRVNTKSELLTKAMSEFSITIFNFNHEEVVQLWKNTLTDSDMTVVGELVRNYQVNKSGPLELNKLDNLKKSILLWLMDKCPLVVLENASLWNIIKICSLQNIVVIRNTSEKPTISVEISHFKTLNDLQIFSDIYRKILQTFTISLQGRESVSLEYLLNIDEKFGEIITPNELLQMTKNTLTVGGSKEKLPDAHVERNISVNTIDTEFFKMLDKNEIIIINGRIDDPSFKNCCKGYKLVDYEEHIAKNYDIFSKVSESTIFLKKSNGPIKKAPKNRSFHHFKIRKNGTIEIMHTKEKAIDLEKYQNLSPILQSEFSKNCINDGITLICAEPGMGKSTFVKHFKNILESNFWSIIVTATDVSQFLRQQNSGKKDFLNYITEIKHHSGDIFEQNMIKIFCKNQKIVFVWDGIDELSDQHLEKTYKIISDLAEQEFPQIITSRSHLKEVLENKFQVSARSVLPFDEEQQTNYMRKRLEKKYPPEQFSKILDGIKLKLEQIHCNEILGIPLEIYMLTEIFYQNAEKYLELSDSFTLVNLYEYFVQERFILIFKEKSKIQEINDFMGHFMDQYKQTYSEKYEAIALRSLLKDDDLDMIEEIFVEESFINDIIANGDSHGLITSIDGDHSVQFHHDSFGEYFVAVYFYKNRSKITQLKDVLFKPRYNNIRFMFDLLMAKGNLLHLAVLHKNFSVFSTLDSSVNITDSGGRNPLHLLFSWENIIKIMKKTDATKTTGKKSDCMYLLTKKYNWKQSDHLFNMNPVEYANLVMSSSTDDSTLIHKSAEEEIITILEILLTDKNVNKIDENGLTPLHKASLNGKEKSVSLLIKAGAEIDIRCSEGYTALYYAFLQNHSNIVKELLKNGADVNLTFDNELTLLHMACQDGLQEFVELFMNYEANLIALDKGYFLPMKLVTDVNKGKEVFQLLEKQTNIVIENQKKLLHACAFGENVEVEEIIRATPYLIYSPFLDDDLHYTPLHIASKFKHVDTVKLLLELELHLSKNDQKASNFKDNEKLTKYVDITNRHGNTPLHYTCFVNCGCETTANVLIKFGADVNKADNRGSTPLAFACVNGFHAIVKLLIDSGAIIDVRDIDGTTPLIEACTYGHYEVAKLLIHFHADINAIDNNKLSTIGSAFHNKHEKIVSLLVEAGVDQSLIERSATPIYAYSGYDDNSFFYSVVIFTKWGVDVNRMEANGWRPIHAACARGNDKITEVLLQAGAFHDVKTFDGKTPLNLAFENGHDNIVQLLRNHEYNMHK